MLHYSIYQSRYYPWEGVCADKAYGKVCTPACSHKASLENTATFAEAQVDPSTYYQVSTNQELASP